MLVADGPLGHRNGHEVAAADPHRVVLSGTERRRFRVRTETVAGRDLGSIVSRELADGNVHETAAGSRLWSNSNPSTRWCSRLLRTPRSEAPSQLLSI